MDLTTDRIDRQVAGWGPTTLRISAALLWLSNVSWKVPPDFGDVGDRCSGLCGYVNAGVEHSVLPGSSWMFEQVVQPQLQWFGYLVLFTEAALAATLLSGRFLRVAAVVGMVQSAVIGLAVANAEGEWYWSYGLMIALHLAILISAPVLRATTVQVMAGLTVGYGVVVALAHLSGGITGDGSFTLFEQRNDFPGDFGRNVFPGSIGLATVFVAVGVGLWFLRDAPMATRRAVGWVIVAVAGVLLGSYGTDGLLIGLGSRASSAAVLAAAGLCLTVTGREAGNGGRSAARGGLGAGVCRQRRWSWARTQPQCEPSTLRGAVRARRRPKDTPVSDPDDLIVIGDVGHPGDRAHVRDHPRHDRTPVADDAGLER